MELITHTFYSVLHCGDWLTGGLSVNDYEFCFISLSSSNLNALSPFSFPPLNSDMYNVYHVLKCIFLDLSRLDKCTLFCFRSV